jgi:RNase P subunit RPR2
MSASAQILKEIPKSSAKPGITTALCICGVGVKEEKRDNEYIVFVCPGCNTEYGYPADSPNIQTLRSKSGVVLMPGFKPATEKQPDPPKNYHCKKCGTIISKEQALSSYYTHEKALCAPCMENY